MCIYINETGLQKRVSNEKLFYLFLNQNIQCGYSKQPSQLNCSFEHSKHMYMYAQKICLPEPIEEPMRNTVAQW